MEKYGSLFKTRICKKSRSSNPNLVIAEIQPGSIIARTIPDCSD